MRHVRLGRGRARLQRHPAVRRVRRRPPHALSNPNPNPSPKPKPNPKPNLNPNPNPKLLLSSPAGSEEVVVLEGRDCARTPSPRAEAPPAASAKVARKPKRAPPKRIGRPYGSSNKAKGRTEGEWHQGKYELQPGVSMVCLAAVDKETGHAQRGVHPSPARER